MASSPLAYYQLNDPGSKLADSGAHALGGSYGASVRHGGPVLTTPGLSSAIFAGSPAGADVPSNAVTVPANPLFATAGAAITIEAWIRTSDYNHGLNFVPVVSYGNDAIGNAWVIEITAQQAPQFFLKTNGGTGKYLLKTRYSAFTPGQVYQLVATYDGSAMSFYINGTLRATMPATGSIDYSGIRPGYGLAIGGALGGARPIFNGAIGNVSIYPTALTAAAVERHFVTGRLVTALNETPADSDAFADSIGINTHLAADGPYTAFATFQSLIESAGIRHIRDALSATPGFYLPRLAALASAGIHATLITSLAQTPQQISALLALSKGSVEAVEGVNEPDVRNPPGWINQTRAAQQALWSTVKTNPATANLPVIGPSIIWEGDAHALGDLSSFMDVGNVHDYFAGFNPGTSGFGPLTQDGVYGSLAFDLSYTRAITGAKPIYATEEGYRAAPGGNTVDAPTLAKYIPRLLLANFLHGFAHSDLYQFFDQPDQVFGLVSASGVPRSSYYAIQSLIRLLGDPGAPFNATPLSYAIAGNTDNVQHLLLQKRDGTYELVIWVETESYDPNLHVDINVVPQSLTVQLGAVPAAAYMTTIGDAGTMSTSQLSVAGGQLNVTIDDHVSVISFR